MTKVYPARRFHGLLPKGYRMNNQYAHSSSLYILVYQHASSIPLEDHFAWELLCYVFLKSIDDTRTFEVESGKDLIINLHLRNPASLSTLE